MPPRKTKGNWFISRINAERGPARVCSWQLMLLRTHHGFVCVVASYPEMVFWGTWMRISLVPDCWEQAISLPPRCGVSLTTTPRLAAPIPMALC